MCVCVCTRARLVMLALGDPMGCRPPASSVYGLFQARILEWVAVSSPGDLPNPGIEPASLFLQH